MRGRCRGGSPAGTERPGNQISCRSRRLFLWDHTPASSWPPQDVTGVPPPPLQPFVRGPRGNWHPQGRCPPVDFSTETQCRDLRRRTLGPSLTTDGRSRSACAPPAFKPPRHSAGVHGTGPRGPAASTCTAAPSGPPSPVRKGQPPWSASSRPPRQISERQRGPVGAAVAAEAENTGRPR